MELVIGPFDPSVHVRSRDHYEAVRRVRVTEELDRWARDSDGAILEASPEIKAYRVAFLAQLCDQLEAGGAKRPELSR